MTIAIVGAGPVGLAAACLLRQQNVDIEVYECLSDKPRQSKAFALHSRTLELLEQIGVTDTIVARGRAIRRMNLYAEQQKLGTLDFKHLNNRFPYFISLPQYELEEILREKLLELGGSIRWGVTVTGVDQTASSVSLNLDGEVCKYEYVIGCDGSHSTIRKQLQVGFPGDTYGSEFLVVDSRLQWSGNKYEAHTFMSKRGYLMVMPFAGCHHRIVTDVQANQFSTTPNIQHVNELLHSKGFTDIELADPEWISTTRYHCRLADNFRFNRVFLAGDACHIHSPVGGQGLNTGLQDAFNLAWKLAMVTQGTATEKMLDTYGVERRHIAKQVLRNTDALTKKFSNTNQFKTMMRRLMTPLLFASPKVQQKVVLDASGLAVNYRSLPHALIDSLGEKNIVGQRMPDLTLRTKNSSISSLYQQLHRTKYELLLMTCEAVDNQVVNQLHDIAKSAQAVGQLHIFIKDEKVELNATNSATNSATNREFIFEQWPAFLSRKKNHILLLRPDGYIHGCYGMTEVASLQQELLGWVSVEQMQHKPATAETQRLSHV